jgi:hypothetical protein
MAFALIGIGLLLFMAAYHNNVAALGSQISADVTGSTGFLIWVVALLVIGAFGYVPVLRGPSRWFLVLVLVVIVLGNKGFFQQFTQALGVADQSGSTGDSSNPPQDKQTPQTPQPSQNATSGGG